MSRTWTNAHSGHIEQPGLTWPLFPPASSTLVLRRAPRWGCTPRATSPKGRSQRRLMDSSGPAACSSGWPRLSTDGGRVLGDYAETRSLSAISASCSSKVSSIWRLRKKTAILTSAKSGYRFGYQIRLRPARVSLPVSDLRLPLLRRTGVPAASRCRTRETAGVVNTAGAAVLGHLWIRTERSCTIDSSLGAVRCENGGRRPSALDP